jgi:hypothetical protein
MQSHPKFKLNVTQNTHIPIVSYTMVCCIIHVRGVFFIVGVHVFWSMLLRFYVTYFNFRFQWYCCVFLDVDFSAISYNIKFDLSCKILTIFRQIDE